MADVFDDTYDVQAQRRARSEHRRDDVAMGIVPLDPQQRGTAVVGVDTSSVTLNEPTTFAVDLEEDAVELRTLSKAAGQRRLSFVIPGGQARYEATVQFNSYGAPLLTAAALNAAAGAGAALPAVDADDDGSASTSADNRSLAEMVNNASLAFVSPTLSQLQNREDQQKEGASAASAEDLSQVSIVYKGLSVAAGDKQILFDVTGEISKGFIAIMGPSGSGKTTLLNAIAARNDPNTRVASGDVRINGEPSTKHNVKRLIGYVMQDDVLLEGLSVRRTLDYACSLRVGDRLNKAERAARILAVCEMMSLLSCLDQPVGPQLSGGERKRIAVALELLAFPKVLFLDEPTSSLDSVDALHVVQCLRTLVRDFGLTVVCTIHQPQYKVFMTFDRLILLSAGRLLFDSPVDRVPEFCAAVNMPVAPGVNPADQVMFVAVRYAADRASMQPFDDGRRAAIDLNKGNHRTGVRPRESSSSWHQFKVLLNRNAALYWQRKHMMLINFVQTVINALLIGFAFRPSIALLASGSATRLSVLAYCCINQGNFGAVSALSAFGAERTICLRERAAGLYGAFPYFAAKVTWEYAARLPWPVLFSVICFWILGLGTTAGDFFYFSFTMCMVNSAAVALAMAVSTVARVNELACIILPMAVEISRLFNSFFVAPVDENPGLGWIRYLSYVNYAYTSLAQQQLSTKTYTCDLKANVSCKPYATGLQQIQALELDDMPYGGQMGLEVAYIVVALAVTYIAMRVLVW